jgi:hypothetical protein
VGPIADPDMVVNRKILGPSRTQTLVVQPIVTDTTKVKIRNIYNAGFIKTLNFYCLDLILHLQGQASQYLAS